MGDRRCRHKADENGVRAIVGWLLEDRANSPAQGLKQNVVKMLESVTGFLEIDRIRKFTMSEYLLEGRRRAIPADACE